MVILFLWYNGLPFFWCGCFGLVVLLFCVRVFLFVVVGVLLCTSSSFRLFLLLVFVLCLSFGLVMVVGDCTICVQAADGGVVWFFCLQHVARTQTLISSFLFLHLRRWHSTCIEHSQSNREQTQKSPHAGRLVSGVRSSFVTDALQSHRLKRRGNRCCSGR